MKQILVLGAGMVSRPLVGYLLRQPNYKVTLADNVLEKATQIIGTQAQGSAVWIDMNDTSSINRLVSGADLVISLVPYIYHPKVAAACLSHGINLVTTSYVSDAMRSMDAEVKKAGLLFLNEIGLDPGIDHMSAMRIIHNARKRGGSIRHFHSYAGGLPAPQDNNNPFGYKFSWSPRGVVLAGRNAAKYLKDGQTIEIKSEDLFTHYWPLKFKEIGELEAYPNRNSLPYIDLYGLEGISTLYRGTLRYPGWCDTWKKLVDLGYLSLEEMDGLEGFTYQDFTARLVGTKEKKIRPVLAKHLGLDADSKILDRFEWLGLLGETPIPPNIRTPLDILAVRLQEKLLYQKCERDMVVLFHEFHVDFQKEHRRERILSTLIAYGDPEGDTAMARTVSLPAAVASHLILEGKIKETGVKIPVSPSIYEPVLDFLEKEKILFHEEIETI